VGHAVRLSFVVLRTAASAQLQLHRADYAWPSDSGAISVGCDSLRSALLRGSVGHHGAHLSAEKFQMKPWLCLLLSLSLLVPLQGWLDVQPKPAVPLDETLYLQSGRALKTF